MSLFLQIKRSLMQHKLWLFLLAILALGACSSPKKVQKMETSIFKKDTAQTRVIAETPKVDSGALVREIMGKLVQKQVDYTTFNAKISVDYQGAEDAQKMTAYVSLKKDSALFVKIAVSPYGIVMNIFVTKDSVVLVKIKGEKSIQFQSISTLQETTKIPFDFKTIQDILVGNPIFIDSNIVSYKSSASQLLVYMVGTIFKNLVTLDNTNFRVLHSKLDDVDELRNRTCDITLSNYEDINGYQFSTSRVITVSEKSKLEIGLEFKNFNFNEPLAYRFSIPKNYKVKEPTAPKKKK